VAGIAMGGPLWLSAQSPPPVIERPIQVVWGSYRHNEDLVDGGASQWTTVQQQMDAYLLHGAYWNYSSNSIGSPSPDIVGPKLAALVNAGNKKVILEHLLAGEYPDIDSAFGTAFAGNVADAAGFGSAISNVKRLQGYGFPQPDISTDFIMSAWQEAVRWHPEWTSKEFFTALTGSWETYGGSQFNPSTGSVERNRYGWFRQWVERLGTAFPSIRVTSTNSPVYFNWNEGGLNRRELGGSFNNFFTWLKLERREDQVTAWYSGDGFGWAPLGSATIPLGSSPRAGLVVSSLNPARLAQGRFDNVRLLPCLTTDIGRPGRGGTLATSGSSYTLTANGNDFLHPGNNTSDAQFYGYREWSGDGTFTVRLDSLVNSNAGRTNPAGEIASAGITLRESTSAGARQVSLLANFANQLEFLSRTATGGGLASVSGSGSPLSASGVTAAPRWLRVSRAGNVISASHSLDGSSWTPMGSTTVTLPAAIQIGMVADSQVRFETATAVFSNVSFLTPVTPAFSGSDIGTAGAGATSSVSGSTFTLKAAGTGCAGIADALRLHSSAFTGDGTLIARLSYFADESSPVTALAAGAQLGITLRTDTTAGSPHATILFTPQLGLRTLSRTASSGSSQEVATYGVGEVSVQPLGSNYRPLLHYFTGNDFMKGLDDAFPGGFSNNFAGFTTDSPYGGYQKWGNSETNADALRHREKIIFYERWLQQQGREHQFIANSAGGNDFDGFNTTTQAGRDAWDMLYKQQSLRSIQLHQLEGGRSDKVLFESWYDGPYTMVPESQNGTFTNLVRDGIRYLKGTGQNLDLLLRSSDEMSFNGDLIYQTVPAGVQLREWRPSKNVSTRSFVVRLVNRGDVDAYPVIHSHETGAAGWTTSYMIGGSDVGSSIRSVTGLPLTDSTIRGSELIAPGASVDLTVTVTANAPVAARDILIRAFWNPQDPAAVVRDSVKLALQPPDDPLLSGIAGDWPFDTNLNDFSGLGRNLTPSGGAAIATSPTKQGGGALNLNAAGSYASTQSTLDFGASFTISGWIYLPSGVSSIRTIAANSASGATTTGFRFYVNSFNTTDGKLVLETANGTQFANVASALGVVAFDTWQHVAAVINRSSGTATLYCNGQVVGSGSIRNDFLNTSILSIGAMAAGNFQLRGTLDDLRLHSRVLSVSEISSLLASSNSPPSITPPVAVTLAAGITSAALTVLVNDAESGPNPLVLTAVSSNTALLPNANLILGGTGANRTLLVTPVAWSAGVATVTLSVSDGIATTTGVFNVTVTNAGNSALWTATGSVAPMSWSTFSNWIQAQPPYPGSTCALEMLTGIAVPPGNHISNQDMANPFSIYQLTLGGSGGDTSVFRVQGNPLSLVTNGAGTPAIVLAATGQLVHRMEVPVALGGNVNVSGDGDATFEFASPVSGGGGLVKAGTSRLTLSGPNNYTGNTDILSGSVRVAHASALGTTGAGTTVQGGAGLAALELSGGVTLAEPMQFVMQNTAGHTQLRNISGGNTLTGQLSLNSGGARWDFASLAGALNIEGPVVNIASATDTWRTLYLSGPGSGTIHGAMSNSSSGNSKLNLNVVSGTWSLSGAPKTYTGGTTVRGGTLAVNTSLTSPVTVQAGGVFTGSGSTSGNLIVQTGATLSARLMDWNTNTVPFSVVQLVAAGATGWTVKADATGITGFTETARTFALVATSNGLMDVNPSAITLDVTGLPGNGLWKTQLTGETLSLVYTPELYAAWTAVTDWNGRDSSPTADPDADGLVNLLEYALGGAPTLPGVGQLPAVTLVAGKLRLFFQRVADPQLLYEVIASDELSLPSVDWEVIWSSTGALNTAGIVTVDDSANASARRFLRLRVIR
jgi:autotransporter-associated beta strand protein